ncbi:transcriptional regulator [Paenibacillus sp. FSL R7-0273]|uniref:Nif3-like dinuclear metal center hexameric protein n=1 Tax=Paenibacillus sp. FSL R7-0273 TaxID=1536772 RepID=UPI0004F72708|nr:Nif3-like dinuclear metal center hexameric protein [Paenibacillus sp. FSL R7-0273]AIQ48509.1 transcriptional regulator [Paenibacillus sp. FSL R7-0273]OMF84078.1 transcriptional regulator [Paenibacillus sp. FSL R7-0273]
MTITFGTVIDWLTAGIPVPEQTVDRLENGAPETEVRGIVTAFTASQYVIEQAAALGANLILSHEGIYYSHHDQHERLSQDPIYLQKSALLARQETGIYRLHDHVHRYTPDGITEGLIAALGWLGYVTEHRPAVSLLTLPPMTAREAAEHVKSKLQIAYVRAAGDLSAACSKIGILVGYRGGGQLAIPLYGEEGLDLIIAGEGPEWETPEYVRDALQQGRSKALIMLGHAESEAPGMKLLAERLAAQFPAVPVHYIPERPVFEVI